MGSRVFWFTNKEYLRLYREWSSREDRDDVSVHLMDREFGIVYASEPPHPNVGVGFIIDDEMKFAMARLKYTFSYA